MIKGKRASDFWPADTMLGWLLYGIIIGLVAVILAIIFNGIGLNQTKIYGNFEQFNLANRMDKCFLVSDGFFSSNTVDFKKFNQETLIDCYRPGRKEFAFRVSLSSKQFTTSSINTPNWVENLPIEKLQARSVVILKDNKKYQGEMTIEVQRQ